ncbi:MAG: hypothetical protein JWM44_1274 [Bacilli bacterium]|jgi:hypothetical protein|nr:hypothetical protein [Bacilli bacterium]
MSEHTKVHTVNNILEARNTIREIEHDGYSKENIFVLTQNKKRTEHISKHTDGNEIGVADEGIITAIANLFRSEGDELRAKLRSMGVSRPHAEQLERAMDKGKIVILAWGGTSYDDDNDIDDQNITYYPPYNFMPLV